MVAAALFMVASADIIRKQYLFFGVDVAAETAFPMTGRARVTASNTLIGLENESMIVHKLWNLGVAVCAVSAVYLMKLPELRNLQGLRV